MAWTRTSTSPAFGRGRSTSSSLSTSGPPYAVQTMAFIDTPHSPSRSRAPCRAILSRRGHQRHLYPRPAGDAYDERVLGKEYHGAQSGTRESPGIRGMITCPACATECPDGSRFCLSCGSSLHTGRALSTERRVITVLFADLVGFTSLSERLDAEDVDRILREYGLLARSAIEAYGGVVEKYIGDAVAGVFGVPRLHEDDAERAVRAALRLIDRLPAVSIADEHVEVRVGINTGPALVRLDVVPGSGQSFIVGDAVNTAARLQQHADPMRVVIGELTHDVGARRHRLRSDGPGRREGQDTDPAAVAGQERRSPARASTCGARSRVPSWAARWSWASSRDLLREDRRVSRAAVRAGDRRGGHRQVAPRLRTGAPSRRGARVADHVAPGQGAAARRQRRVLVTLRDRAAARGRPEKTMIRRRWSPSCAGQSPRRRMRGGSSSARARSWASKRRRHPRRRTSRPGSGCSRLMAAQGPAVLVFDDMQWAYPGDARLPGASGRSSLWRPRAGPRRRSAGAA